MTPNQNTPPQQPQSADEIFFYLRRQTSLFCGEKISPQKIANALYASETGNILELAEIMALMSHDNDLLAPFVKRLVGINALPYSIKAPNSRPTRKERRNVSAIQEIFDDLINMPALLLDITTGILRGISVIEIADREHDDGTSGWRQISTHYARPMSFYPKFVWRDLTWFQLNPDNRHEIRLRDFSLKGVPLKQAHWVIHHHPIISGYIGENGILRQLIWTYAKKNYADDDWSELLEILGIPPRIGKYPSKSSAQDKAVLRRAVTDLGHSSSGIMPESMKIELLEAASLTGSNAFQDRFKLAIRSYEQLILGTSMEDVAKLSSIEGQRFINHATFQRNKWDCHFIEETIRYQIIYWLNGYNNNEWDPLKTPKFVFDPRPVGEFAGNADALLKLIYAGVKIPKKWAHDFFNIPEPGDGEEILELQKNNDKKANEDEIEQISLYEKEITTSLTNEANEANEDEIEQISLYEKEITTSLTNEANEDEIEQISLSLSNQWQEILEPFINAIENAGSYENLDESFLNMLDTTQPLFIKKMAYWSFLKTIQGHLGS